MCRSTQTSHTRCYGYLLEFCLRTERLDVSTTASNSALETIEAFLIELQNRVGSVARHTYISRIRRVAEILNPHVSYRWLREIEHALKHEARPRNRAHRVISLDRLWALGLELMQRAEDAKTGQTCSERGFIGTG